MIPDPCGVVDVLIGDQCITRITEGALLFRVGDGVPGHDGHEPAQVHGTGTEAWNAFVQHAGEKSLERHADDVSELQAARAAGGADPVPQVDDIQVDGKEDV